MSYNFIQFVKESAKTTTDVIQPKEGPSKPQSSAASIYQEVLALPKSSSSPQLFCDEQDTYPRRLCKVCGRHIAEDAWLEHIRSVGHLVSTVPNVSAPTTFHLDESNIGFRILSKTGWEYGSGLGAQGQGKRHPITAKVKASRSGIGAKEQGARGIKHYGTDLPQSTQRSRNKKEILRQHEEDERRRQLLLTYMKR
ncbi:hypothetical protein EV182_006383 [Spiromyces aspiralis]|uniref:Uncharacterized protein n=1 Tax=Spiromyces aspiralis TaxID=68401 RepID=A0ACC1HAY4_9FUNG|nr:hypothetical protein EV182_006383 [Spiromyces aspiralis]